jgi:hypothetical protein
MSDTLRPPQAKSRPPFKPKWSPPLPLGWSARRQGCLDLGWGSGIGRSVAIGFAKEGANAALTYLDEHGDGQEAVRLIAA